jgi:hypothetical protein
MRCSMIYFCDVQWCSCKCSIYFYNVHVLYMRCSTYFRCSYIINACSTTVIEFPWDVLWYILNCLNLNIIYVMIFLIYPLLRGFFFSLVIFVLCFCYVIFSMWCFCPVTSRTKIVKLARILEIGLFIYLFSIYFITLVASYRYDNAIPVVETYNLLY